MTAHGLQALGANLGVQGKATEAGLLLREALEIQRRLLGSTHPETAAALHSPAWHVRQAVGPMLQALLRDGWAQHVAQQRLTPRAPRGRAPRHEWPRAT